MIPFTQIANYGCGEISTVLFGTGGGSPGGGSAGGGGKKTPTKKKPTKKK